jgi:hypothetical protein
MTIAKSAIIESGSLSVLADARKLIKPAPRSLAPACLHKRNSATQKKRNNGTNI